MTGEEKKTRRIFKRHVPVLIEKEKRSYSCKNPLHQRKITKSKVTTKIIIEMFDYTAIANQLMIPQLVCFTDFTGPTFPTTVKAA